MGHRAAREDRSRLVSPLRPREAERARPLRDVCDVATS
jgi:hypothetical protein